MRKFLIIFLLGSTAFISACNDKNDNEFEEVNSWIRESMEENYLWNERVPEKVDGSIPSGAYFGSILDPNDFFSYMVNNSSLVDDNSTGTSFTTGLSPTFGRFFNSNGVFIVTEFVYPNTPADTAGLTRGDIILSIDGTLLNTSNFLSLFYGEQSSITYSLGEHDPIQNTIRDNGEVVTLPQSELELNPVVYTGVIVPDSSNSKIGYLFYAEFVDGENNKFNDSVDVALQDMMAEGITDLIVDLRYNSGGSFAAAENLANALVAPAAVQNEEVFVRFQYNNVLEQRIIDEEGSDSENLVLKFSSDPENLGFQNIYFLTSNQTSSTSELLINGLIPHMNVNTIGEATKGEFFGSTVISGENATPANEYAIVPINLQYENSEGSTNLVFGIQPSIEVEDDLLNTFQIGDINDPVLNAAIKRITNGTQTSAKTSVKEYEVLIDKKAQRKGRMLFRTEKKN